MLKFNLIMKKRVKDQTHNHCVREALLSILEIQNHLWVHTGRVISPSHDIKVSGQLVEGLILHS